MNQEIWTQVDQYFADTFLPSDYFLDEALARSHAAGLPAINVAPNQGKMLYLLARMQNPKRILEVGTLGGYSTIWLARSLPVDGKLITLENEAKHAEIARENIARAGFGKQVDVRVGRAADTLAKMHAANEGPFDFIFIDADKPSNSDYVQWAIRLARPGSAIVVDNVVRKGEILDAAHSDERVQGTRKLYEMLAREPQLSATSVQTVGSKGHDGFVLAIVN